MKPAPFEYLAPRTVPEAVSLLARHGEEAKLLAGGQSLVPLMNMRLARPRRVIDLNRTQGLAYIREVNGALRIGRRFHNLDTGLLLDPIDKGGRIFRSNHRQLQLIRASPAACRDREHGSKQDG